MIRYEDRFTTINAQLADAANAALNGLNLISHVPPGTNPHIDQALREILSQNLPLGYHISQGSVANAANRRTSRFGTIVVRDAHTFTERDTCFLRESVYAVGEVKDKYNIADVREFLRVYD